MQDKPKVKGTVLISLGRTGVLGIKKNPINTPARLRCDFMTPLPLVMSFSEYADEHVNGNTPVSAVHVSSLFGILSEQNMDFNQSMQCM